MYLLNVQNLEDTVIEKDREKKIGIVESTKWYLLTDVNRKNAKMKKKMFENSKEMRENWQEERQRSIVKGNWWIKKEDKKDKREWESNG